MASGLQSASFSLGELFSGPFLFNVPVYQRPYSWEQEHAAKLLDNLLEAAGLDGGEEPDPEYFLGTILLMDPTGNDNVRLGLKMSSREFDIVDGQQRLVTLLTLFAVLRDLEPSQKSALARRVGTMVAAQQGARFFRTERHRIHVSNRERKHFEMFVLEPGSTLLQPPQTNSDEPESSLMEVRDHFVSVLKELKGFERAQLFDYVASHCSAVIILSRDIDRAHRMFIVLNEGGKELQRNDILKADVISGLPSADVDWAVKEWDAASARLGDEFETYFGHLRAIYGHTRPQIVSGVRAVVQQEGGAGPFLRNAFLPLADTYAVMRGGDENPDVGLTATMRKYLTYLNRLPDGDWAPAAMLALKDRQSDPKGTEYLLAEIDRLAHLLRLLCLGTGKRVRRFASVVTAIRDGSALNPKHPAFAVSRDEVRNIAFHLKDLHKRNQKICKLLLFRLNDEIDGRVSALEPERYTIEHVLPQRPPRTSEWCRWYPAADVRGQCTENLGNLVLISPKQNDKARNALFGPKKQIYLERDGSAALLSMTRAVLQNEEWRQHDIEAREEQLLEHLRKIWRIDLPAVRAVAGAEPAQKVTL